ncbi:DNA sulfur modification protein DndB [Ectobacillus funiculus]|uniref:DNA sulfur modification protein DndB n=1 Tax=Ectobacillus funiculus TaxID=137993 RepID=UPI00101C323C|nr:DNA sulfur modification protein DndB [Ectobacillus funiculus]
MLIPNQSKITNDQIQQDPNYKNLRIVRYASNEQDRSNYTNRTYKFQHDHADYTVIKATLCRKGAEKIYRLVAIVHPTMKQFVDIIKYDPSNPPTDDYLAHGMIEAHEQTQSDFQGQKKQNALDFRNYILEGIAGHRTLYLPTVTGWQSTLSFEKTIFVTFDEENPNAMYGELYLPKDPVMQADGQTQTAAIFQASKTIEAITSGALDSLSLTLEIELNVSTHEAGQSFADRNGRGSKKNKNLVIKMDRSSPLSQLRVFAIEGTVFENRIADGRTTGTSETATGNIVDLSTMEQMLINVVANGRIKPEKFQHYYIDAFKPYVREFIRLLDQLFAKYWPAETPENMDPYRRLYVHGWPFALKALAKAYHQVRIEEIGPLAAAIGTEKEVQDASKNLEEKFLIQAEKRKEQFKGKAPMALEEFVARLKEIDWHRYRTHWIAITGHSVKDGKKKVFKLKSTGEEKVVAYAPNTAAVIDVVADKLLSNKWIELCRKEDEPVN